MPLAGKTLRRGRPGHPSRFSSSRKPQARRAAFRRDSAYVGHVVLDAANADVAPVKEEELDGIGCGPSKWALKPDNRFPGGVAARRPVASTMAGVLAAPCFSAALFKGATSWLLSVAPKAMVRSKSSPSSSYRFGGTFCKPGQAARNVYQNNRPTQRTSMLALSNVQHARDQTTGFSSRLRFCTSASLG